MKYKPKSLFGFLISHETHLQKQIRVNFTQNKFMLLAGWLKAKIKTPSSSVLPKVWGLSRAAGGCFQAGVIGTWPKSGRSRKRVTGAVSGSGARTSPGIGGNPHTGSGAATTAGIRQHEGGRNTAWTWGPFLEYSGRIQPHSREGWGGGGRQFLKKKLSLKKNRHDNH